MQIVLMFLVSSHELHRIDTGNVQGTVSYCVCITELTDMTTSTLAVKPVLDDSQKITFHSFHVSFEFHFALAVSC
jgi:hypothetical protein